MNIFLEILFGLFALFLGVGLCFLLGYILLLMMIAWHEIFDFIVNLFRRLIEK